MIYSNKKKTLLCINVHTHHLPRADLDDPLEQQEVGRGGQQEVERQDEWVEDSRPGKGQGDRPEHHWTLHMMPSTEKNKFP